MQVKLEIVGGKTNKRDVMLRLPSVIGRSREADLTVAHPMISRKHCQLREVDGLLMIQDLGSLNGTLIGDAKIEGEKPLHPGTEFSVGPLTFRVDYEYVGEIASAPVDEAPEEAAPEEEAPDFVVETADGGDDELAVEQAESEQPASAEAAAEEAFLEQPAEQPVAEEPSDQPAAAADGMTIDKPEEADQTEAADDGLLDFDELGSEELDMDEFDMDDFDTEEAPVAETASEPEPPVEEEEPGPPQPEPQAEAAADEEGSPLLDVSADDLPQEKVTPDVDAWAETQNLVADDLVSGSQASAPDEQPPEEEKKKKKKGWWPLGKGKAGEEATEEPAAEEEAAETEQAPEQPAADAQPSAELEPEPSPEPEPEPELEPKPEPELEPSAEPEPEQTEVLFETPGEEIPAEQEPEPEEEEEERSPEDEALDDFLKGLS